MEFTNADNRISYGHFHVSKIFNEPVDKVRRVEQKALLSGGGSSMARSR